MSFRSLLLKHNLTAYALSKKTGISQSTISSWTSGMRNPKGMSLNKAIKICMALDLDLNTLYRELCQEDEELPF